MFRSTLTREVLIQLVNELDECKTAFDEEIDNLHRKNKSATLAITGKAAYERLQADILDHLASRMV